jgi:hypothetical protein
LGQIFWFPQKVSKRKSPSKFLWWFLCGVSVGVGDSATSRFCCSLLCVFQYRLLVWVKCEAYLVCVGYETFYYVRLMCLCSRRRNIGILRSCTRSSVSSRSQSELLLLTIPEKRSTVGVRIRVHTHPSQPLTLFFSLIIEGTIIWKFSGKQRFQNLFGNFTLFRVILWLAGTDSFHEK